jgi:hypothetical protein
MSEQERSEMGAEEYVEHVRDYCHFRGLEVPDFAYQESD